MAEHSQAATVNDSSKHPGTTAAADVAEIRGKMSKYDILKTLYESASKKRQMAAEQLEKADAEFEQFKREYSKLSDELRSLKEHSPEAAPILSDFTPFQDIPATATAPLLTAAAEPQLSVTEKILKVARDTQDLERRYEMMKVMLQEKTAEVEKLNEELRHSECGMKLLQEKISQLNAEIAKLKAGMSPDGSSTALSPIGDGDVQLMTEPFDSLNGTASPPELRGADDVAVDPAVMQEKIKQLTSRISELLNHNRQWEKKCRQLMSEVEAAKRQLVECQQLTEQKLEEERQKTNRAVAERDDALAEKDKHEALCRQLSADVARLEATVRDMEYQGLRSNGPDEEINSERVAYQFQIEEYQRDLEAERESHKRTKAKSESLDQQRNTLLQALNAKKKELNDAKAKMERLQEENRRFQDLLEKANIDRELIQGHLSGHDVTSIGQLRGHDTTKTGLLSGHDVMSTGQSADEAKKMTGDKSRDQRASHSSSKAKPSRGTLEEDRAVAVPPEVRRGGCSEQAARWSCDVCSYYNSGEESPNSCKICTAKRGRVVSYPVQESRVSSAYSEQGALISYKPMSCSGSSSSSKVGRSKLEEDGAVTSRAMRVVY